jgi:hypothetical protein
MVTFVVIQTDGMKNVSSIILLLAILSSCGGSLSDEQRKKIKENMEENKIVQMTDSEITMAALDEGRLVFSALEKVKFNPEKLDSISNRYRVKIKWLVPGTPGTGDIEQQLIDAYVSGIATGSLQDNVQKMYAGNDAAQYDSLLYTRPIVTTLPDGADNLNGIWNIYLSKKHVVLTAAAKQ